MRLVGSNVAKDLPISPPYATPLDTLRTQTPREGGPMHSSTVNPLVAVVEDLTPVERLDLDYLAVRVSGPDRCLCPECRPDLPGSK